jgi:uncharacterized protein YggT (Ycf19 family)
VRVFRGLNRQRMGAIDFILNLAGLLLWLSWRSMHFDPLIKGTPVTLIGTLTRAEPRRLKGWQVCSVLALIVTLRAVLYWLIGAPADWTPKVNLEFVVLAFRGDSFRAALVYSCVSFLRALIVFYFWLMVLAMINRASREPDPIQKLVRLHLGRTARWPWPVQLLFPLLIVIVLWCGLHPLLVYLGVMASARSTAHLVGQGSLVGLSLLLSLKYVLPALLFLHLVASYVYLGNNPVWEFVATTSANVTWPLRRLPLRFAKLDFTPAVGVLLILWLLQWLPNLILARLAASQLSAWPQ